MKISTGILILLLQAFAALGVLLDARRRPGRNVGLDVAMAFLIPVLGVFLYLGSTREQRRAEAAAAKAAGLSPVAAQPGVPRYLPSGPATPDATRDPSIVAELTAEVRRLRAELGATREERDAALAEVKRLGGNQPQHRT